MIDEGTRMRAAVRAEQELSMTEAAFDGLQIAMVNELINTNYDQGPAREHLYHGLRALKDVRQALKDMVRAGKDAKAMEEAAAALAKGAQS